MRKIAEIIGVFIILSMFTTQLMAGSKQLKLDTIWTHDTKTQLESTATLADINNDGKDEIIVAGREEIIAVDGKGQKIWNWVATDRFCTYPAVYTRKDGTVLIFAADGNFGKNSGTFTCLDGDGKVVWQKKLNANSSWSAPIVADLNNDGKVEVIQTDESGVVWLFDAESGNLLWKTSIEGKPSSPSVGDLNGDGKLEIAIVTGKGKIFAIDSDGKILWKTKLAGISDTWATSSAVIFEASDGKSYVVSGSNTGGLFCLDKDGKIIWKRSLDGPIAATISIADFDDNGKADIFAITQLGMLYRFDEDGKKIWDINMQGRTLAPAAIIDINNDGKLELVMSTQQGNLLAFSNEGQIIFNHQFNNRTINVTPTFGNITNSKTLDMVITGGESGKVFCFSTPASLNTKMPWGAYRKNNQNIGSWSPLGDLKSSEDISTARMVPQNLTWNALATGDDIIFNVFNPGADNEKMLNASVSYITPEGTMKTVSGTVIGKSGSFKMPVDFTIPGNYNFVWTLKDTAGNEIFAGNKKMMIRPFENDRALFANVNAEIEKVLKTSKETLPLSYKALTNEKYIFDAEVKNIKLQQDAVAKSTSSEINNTLNKSAELVAKAERLDKLAKIIGQVADLGVETSMVPFEAELWTNVGVDKQVPSSLKSPFQLSADAFPGETHPIALSILNITNKMLQVRLKAENLPEGISYTALKPTTTVSSIGEKTWDALPKFNNSGILEIPPLSTRQIWINIDIADDLTGKQDIKFVLEALNGAGISNAPINPQAIEPKETVVNVSLNVLPFKMVPSGNFRLGTWPKLDPKGSDAEVKDLLAHGNNIFTIQHGKITYDNSGKIEKINFSGLDHFLKTVKGHDVFLTVGGTPAIKAKVGTKEYKRDLKIYLTKLVDYLKGEGISKDNFALYAQDEPGGHGWDAVNKVAEYGKLVKDIDPEIMTYVNGGGELPMFEKLAPVTDVWVPGINMLTEDSPTMKLLKSTGRYLWSYNCSYSSARPTGPNVKNANIFAEYRNAALLALQYGATGIGYWTYNSGGEDAWARIKNEYNLVYPSTDGGVVSSRRWEAVREGIEDARIVMALQDYQEKNKNANSIAVNKINHLLEVTLPELVVPMNKAVQVGLNRESIDFYANQIRLDKFRKEMLECVKLVVANK